MKNIPSHMLAEGRMANTWTAISGISSFLLFLLWAFFLPFISWSLGHPHLNIYILHELPLYLQSILNSPFAVLWAYFFSPTSHHTTMDAIMWLLFGFAATMALGYIVNSVNPYRSALMLHGDARFADERDLDAMEELKQIGPSGTYLHFGFLGKRKISLIETISVLLLAPPGTGKTAGFVVPSLIATDDSCFLVNDPKPELWDLTSGHRQKLGPTFRLEWPAIDDPSRDIYYPRFNFLDPRVVPPEGPLRDTFIDALTQTLVPEEKGGQTYFVDKGRAALAGFCHALVSKINDRSDPERYEGIPEIYHSLPASLPMLVEWMSHLIASSLDSGGGGNQDPMGAMLSDLHNECIERNYSNRAKMEIAQLAPMAKDERSGVLGTLDQKLLPFKNSAVAQRASTSTFIPTDLRGRLTPKALERMGFDDYPATPKDWARVRNEQRPGDWAPVTVYCCVNQAVASAFASITSLFFQVCSTTLLSSGPGETTADGTLLGPYPVCFLMDEFAKLPKINAVLEGPDLGRSKKTYYFLIAQDYGQIGKIYSKEDQELINGTTGVKLILPQNNPESVRKIADMVGKTTVERKSISRSTGLSKNAEMFGGNVSTQLEGVNLLSTGDLVHMPRATHLILAQNFLHRPIRARTPLFFLDKNILPNVHNPRTGLGPPPSQPMPTDFSDEIIDQRNAARKSRVENYLTDRIRHWRTPNRLANPPHTGP